MGKALSALRAVQQVNGGSALQFWMQAVSSVADSGGGAGLSNVLIVDPKAKGTGTIGSFTDPFPTLVAAMAKVQSGDVILLVPGTHVVPPNTVFPAKGTALSFTVMGLDESMTILQVDSGDGPTWNVSPQSGIGLTNLTVLVGSGNGVGVRFTSTPANGSTLVINNVRLAAYNAAEIDGLDGVRVSKIQVYDMGRGGATNLTIKESKDVYLQNATVRGLRLEASTRSGTLHHYVSAGTIVADAFTVDGNVALSVDSSCSIEGAMTVSPIANGGAPQYVFAAAAADMTINIDAAFDGSYWPVDLSGARVSGAFHISYTGVAKATVRANEATFTGTIVADGNLVLDTRGGFVREAPAAGDFINGALWDRDVYVVSASPSGPGTMLLVPIEPSFPNNKYTVLVEDNTGGCFSRIDAGSKSVSGFYYDALSAGSLNFVVQRNPD